MTFSRLQRFFWICSGTPLSVIEKYPTEHSKYLGIGGTIFFTAFFAGLSGGYALYFVFAGSNLAELSASVFGLTWGIAIFNLDRYIVSGINKSGNLLKQFYQASPRFVFALLIAMVIARPLELKIFDKEIYAVLRARYLSGQSERIIKVQQAFKEKYAQESTQLITFQKEYESLSSELNRLREELKAEVFGSRSSTTSGVEGYGTYAKNKEAVILAKQSRLEYLAGWIAGLQEFLNRQKAAEGINNQMMLSEAELYREAANAGFADRNWALGELTNSSNDQSRSSANAVAFITLLFVAFECAPLMVKLLSDVGPSDVEIRETESRIIEQLTNNSFLSRNRIVRQYSILGVKTGRRRARRYLSNKRR
jgi:hypothetical protein